MNRVINILLIEDDPLDQRQVERAFEKKGILTRIKVARNGEDALNFLTNPDRGDFEGLPDIILLDINMPKMNGTEFLIELRRHNEYSGIKIFILTNSEQEKDKITDLGVSGYIIKPLRLNSPSMDSMPLMIDIMNMQINNI